MGRHLLFKDPVHPGRARRLRQERDELVGGDAEINLPGSSAPPLARMRIDAGGQAAKESTDPEISKLAATLFDIPHDM